MSRGVHEEVVHLRLLSERRRAAAAAAAGMSYDEVILEILASATTRM